MPSFLNPPPFCPVCSEMTLLSSQPKPLDSAPTSDSSPSASAGSEDPEQRMLEKRAKVIEELLQTEKDYIKDLQMCVEEIIEPLQGKQVHDENMGGKHEVAAKCRVGPLAALMENVTHLHNFSFALI